MIKTITNGIIRAQIDTKGAELISLQKDGKEYIWQRNPEFWKDCSPILFPVVGRSKDKILNIKGKDYPMPSHGFVQYTELTVEAESETAVTLSMTQSEETKKLYPWDFKFLVTYSLEGAKLTVALRVENTDDEAIMFGIGGHPGFNLPMNDGESFEDYCLEFEKEEELYSNRVLDNGYISATQKDLLLSEGTRLPLTRSLFNHDAIIFEDIASKWVKLIHQKSQKGIRFCYDGFPIFAAWTREEPYDGATFLCLEPWIGMGIRDNEGYTLEEKYGIKTLLSGEDFTVSFSAEIMD